SYAWYSSADGFTSPVGTGTTYLVREVDEGHTIDVKATATSQQGLTHIKTSAATATVTDAAPVVSTPTIGGIAQEGATLTAAATSEQGLTDTKTSTATAAVTDAGPVVSTPTIGGTAEEGATLTAAATATDGDNPVTYAWYSSADNFANAIGTGATYVVKEI